MTLSRLAVAALLVAAPVAAFANEDPSDDIYNPNADNTMSMEAAVSGTTMGTTVSGTMAVEPATMGETMHDSGMMKKDMHDAAEHETMKKSSH